MRSHIPPIWDACGTLNIHVIPELLRNCWTGPSSTFTVLTFISSDAPIKFEPLSDLIHLTGPRIDKNLRKAFMNDELDISSTTSTWIALVDKHVKMIPHLLLLAEPPRVFRALTCHGPNASIPIEVKGGPGVNRSVGTSAIFWVSKFLRSFLHVTHLCMYEVINLRAPRSQYPPLRSAPSVNNLPWWLTYSWKWWISRVDTWLRLGKIIGLISWDGICPAARLIRPPTRKILSLSR